ncbi:MAG: DMT family transporter, partial [Hyphomonadaceae bacterium]
RHCRVPSARLHVQRAGGVGVGCVGVCLVCAPALSEQGIGATPVVSQLLLLAAAVLYGSTSVMVRMVNPNLHPVAMSCGFVLVAAILSLPLAIQAWPEGGVHLEARHFFAILGLGVLSTGVANLVYVLTIRRVGPVFMSNVGNLAPFWSILVGALAFGEALPATTFAALAILLFGVWLVQRQGAR